MGLVLFGVIWELASWIVAGADRNLAFFGLSLLVIAFVVYRLHDWRTGVLVFLAWLLFEDLVRKYLGNSMTVYFIKDALVGIAYLSFYLAKRRRQVETFKASFFVPLGIFFGFGIIQIFNPLSPNILYGLVGLKLYFYYVPLMFLGYAMLKSPKDLERLLVFSMVLGIMIAGLGIAQSVLGVSFLTPVESTTSNIYNLTHLTRYAPITHQAVFSPSSVFVSAGRFSFYLILLWILAMGMQGYLLLARRPGAKYGFLGIGVVTVAVMVTGTRTPFVFVLGSGCVMASAFLWGAPWRWGQGHRMVKALRQAALFGGIGLILMVEIFPNVIGGDWAFFSETLSFSGPGSELVHRSWGYPMRQFEAAFESPRWPYGNGIGVASLGIQYISQFLGEPPPNVGVENGYGVLVVEFGIVGLALWFIWVSALLLSGWRVVRRLRQTVYFPIGFAIWWYAVVMLVLLMHLGMQSYQNFVNNAYLWLLVGVLFRLPKLAQLPQPVTLSKRERAMSRWQLAVGRR